MQVQNKLLVKIAQGLVGLEAWDVMDRIEQEAQLDKARCALSIVAQYVHERVDQELKLFKQAKYDDLRGLHAYSSDSYQAEYHDVRAHVLNLLTHDLEDEMSKK